MPSCQTKTPGFRPGSRTSISICRFVAQRPSGSELVGQAQARRVQVVVEGIGARLGCGRNAAAAVAEIEDGLVLELHVEIFAADDPVVGERIFHAAAGGPAEPRGVAATDMLGIGSWKIIQSFVLDASDGEAALGVEQR